MSTSPTTDAAAIETWWRVRNEAEIPTPALLLFRERAQANIARMIEIAGSADRLRPHVKTHKLGPLVRAQIAAGITKFKCATIAEAAMTAEAGAREVLLAYPVVGPAAKQLVKLQAGFLEVAFSAIVDSSLAAAVLSKEASEAGVTLGVYLDVDCGMHRTGIEPGHEALKLYQRICNAPGLEARGLHAYDGHIHEADLAERTRLCMEAFAGVLELREKLQALGMPVPELIAGGSPTFAIHAEHKDRELSPGTTVLWDFGYGDKFPELAFQPAALVLMRVVSKPGANRLCLDLGHKAIAAENPAPRVHLLELPDAVAVMHSEEHLVVETPLAEQFAIGQCLHGIPRHICPTVALHDVAWVVEDGVATDRWRIAARDRQVAE